MAGSRRMPQLRAAEQFLSDRRGEVLPPYQGLWRGDGEIDAINHALSIDPAGMDMEGLAGRVVRLLRGAYGMERAPRLGRDWHQPLPKVVLPITLGLVPPSKLGVSSYTLMGAASDEYRYYGPRAFFTAQLFEPHLRVIERMWRGPVIIMPIWGLGGAVSIRSCAG